MIAFRADLVEQALVVEAGLELGLAHAGLLDAFCKASSGSFTKAQLASLLEQQFDQRLALVARAAGQHGAGGGERIERKFAQDKAHFAVVDIFGLESAGKSWC